MESHPSRPRTRPVWTRSICPSWRSWGRPRCHLQEEDIPAVQEEPPEPLDPTATSLLRLVPGPHSDWLRRVCSLTRFVPQNRPPWMSSGPTENRNYHGMGGPTGPGGPQSFPPPMPNMGGPPMPPNPNGMPPPWMQPPPPPMGQGPSPHGHPMGETLMLCYISFYFDGILYLETSGLQ